ncbi:hypothetical protein Val02_76940 [Virgisporangium aliadipatigenens]|uniref:Glycosyltransferase RgtA/B/C/D-like domain-containing protein n=1 Tax=Virgisporangium aliadipatigenens TaxID=741659 RepID=A0A8J3YUL4_9ACTN|nr:hypothetical protein [Virgisporangium aliadipatigenens]GIJ50808.1 hypothetical protein Val02_76940 [Virgisporangium aliadipatigenens]
MSDSLTVGRGSASSGETGELPARPPRQSRRRFLTHEWTLASIGSVLLAVVMTWPVMLHPASRLPWDLGDPALQAWQMAWAGHALPRDPVHVFHSNTFYPEWYSFAFSDTLMGYAPAGLIGSGVTAAIVRYNILFVLAFALAFLGMYALVRQLGGTVAGAALAGAVFSFAPWRWAHAGHLNILSSGGIALAFAMLARGHGYSFRHGYRPDRADVRWIVAGWIVAAWQLSLGFSIGLPFAYALVLVIVLAFGHWLLFPRAGRAEWWRTRKAFPRRLLIANVGGGAVFALVGALMARPYLKVFEQHPYARRGIPQLEEFGPPPLGLVTAPEESWLWAGPHAGMRESLTAQGEMAVFMGYTVLVLALVGLVVSTWSLRLRALLAAGAVIAAVLALGVKVPGDGRFTYLPLYNHLPGWDGMRTPGRLIMWSTVCAAVLAAGAIGALAERLRGFAALPRPAARHALLLLPVALVLVEGVGAVPHPYVPKAPTAALRAAEPPLLILPFDHVPNQLYMLWSADGLPKMVNGGSGFAPSSQFHFRDVAATFPDAGSVQTLRADGIRTLVVLRDRVAGTPFARVLTAPVPVELGVRRVEVGDAVLFYLD